MPLRLKHRSGRKGVVTGALGDITGSLAGTFATVNNVTGVLKPVLADVTGGLVGQFLPTAQRTGTFAGTLANVTGQITGDANSLPVWTTGANLGTVAPNTPFSFPLTATDIDGDTITITRVGSLPGSTQEVINAQSGNNRSVTWSSTTGLAAGTYQVTYDATDGINSVNAQQDWLARINLPGVLWSHDFSTDAQVTKFTTSSKVTRATSGGPGDFPYLRCLNPVGQGASGNSWFRPLSPLPGEKGYVSGPDFDKVANAVYGNWPRGYYGHPDYWSEFPGQFAGHEFYCQMRVRVTRGRWTTPGQQDGGKVLWFVDTGYTPDQELNYQALNDGRFQGYIDFGANDAIITASPQHGIGGQFQSVQAGGLWDQLCSWTVGGSYPTNCWKWPGYYSATRAQEWVVFLLRVKLGHECGSFSTPNAGSQDSEIDVWVAEESDLPSNGGSGYKLLIRRTNAMWTYTPGRVKGLNAMTCSAYYNGLTFTEAWEQDWAQLIFSTQFIPCPQV